MASEPGTFEAWWATRRYKDHKSSADAFNRCQKAWEACQAATEARMRGLVADWKERSKEFHNDGDNWEEGCATGYGQAAIELEAALAAIPGGPQPPKWVRP